MVRHWTPRLPFVFHDAPPQRVHGALDDEADRKVELPENMGHEPNSPYELDGKCTKCVPSPFSIRGAPPLTSALFHRRQNGRTRLVMHNTHGRVLTDFVRKITSDNFLCHLRLDTLDMSHISTQTQSAASADPEGAQ